MGHGQQESYAARNVEDVLVDEAVYHLDYEASGVRQTGNVSENVIGVGVVILFEMREECFGLCFVVANFEGVELLRILLQDYFPFEFFFYDLLLPILTLFLNILHLVHDLLMLQLPGPEHQRRKHRALTTACVADSEYQLLVSDLFERFEAWFHAIFQIL